MAKQRRPVHPPEVLFGTIQIGGGKISGIEPRNRSAGLPGAFMPTTDVRATLHVITSPVAQSYSGPVAGAAAEVGPAMLGDVPTVTLPAAQTRGWDGAAAPVTAMPAAGAGFGSTAALPAAAYSAPLVSGSQPGVLADMDVPAASVYRAQPAPSFSGLSLGATRQLSEP